MAELHVRLLGGFAASLDGRALSTFGTAKVQALLAYLMVESSKPQKREYLAGLFWSDCEQEKALHNLRQAVSALRKTLQDNDTNCPFILSFADEIQFNPKSQFNLDVDRFLTDYHEGISTGSIRMNPVRLKRAADIFRGPFLDRYSVKEADLFDEWVILKREVYNQLFIDICTQLCDYHERRSEYSNGRDYASRMAEYFPWNENSHYLCMRMLAMEEKFTGAENQYHICKKYLEEQLQITPSIGIEDLYCQIRERIPIVSKTQNTDLLKSIQQTSGYFEGRETEISEISDLLRRNSTRLVTIHGPGGIGKTRLALELAGQQIGIFPDGVYFTSLAGVQEASQLPAVIARSLGLVVSNRQEVKDQVESYLSNKQLLLVLDNSDTLAGAADILSAWIKKIPGLILLVTSRERLILREEIVYPLSGLAYPESESAPDFIRCPAVKLFLDHLSRVGRMEPGLQEWKAILQICREMEGLPLGLELAAALTWNNPITDIANTISSNLGQIKANYPDIPSRHRSLDAVFEYSWDLLSPDLKSAFQSLAVFPADFTFPLAEEICRITSEQLESLINKSLVRINISGRYELHALIQKYAFQQLTKDTSEIPQELRNRFTHAFYMFVLEKDIHPISGELFSKNLLVQKELASIYQTWEWLMQDDLQDKIMDLVVPLYTFFTSQSRFEECLSLFQNSLSAFKQGTSNKLSIRLNVHIGAIEHIISKRPDIIQFLEDNVERARELELWSDVIVGQIHLISAIKNRGQANRAGKLAKETLQIAMKYGDDWGVAYANHLLGSIAHQCGEIETAIRYFEKCLEMANHHQADLIRMMALNALGDVYCHVGDLQKGRQMFLECLETSRRLGTHYQIAIHLNNLGTIDQIEGDLESAEKLFTESLDECRMIGDDYGEGIALCNLGEIAITQNEVEKAGQIFTRAMQIGQEMGDDYINQVCYTNLAEVARLREDLTEAIQYLQKAVRLGLETDMLPKLMTTFVYASPILLQKAKPRESEALLHLVIEHEASEDYWREKARQQLNQYHSGYKPKSSISIGEAVKIIEVLS